MWAWLQNLVGNCFPSTHVLHTSIKTVADVAAPQFLVSLLFLNSRVHHALETDPMAAMQVPFIKYTRCCHKKCERKPDLASRGISVYNVPPWGKGLQEAFCTEYLYFPYCFGIHWLNCWELQPSFLMLISGDRVHVTLCHFVHTTARTITLHLLIANIHK